MRRITLPIIFFTILATTSTLSAQTTLDNALSISRDLNNGTARFKAMGGANTSLGGDISSISGNPAGLGFYGQSDFSISVNYLNNANKASYFGQNTNLNKGQFGLENLGIVFHSPTHNNPDYGWQNFNVGISIDKKNNYFDHLSYAGINADNSLVHNLTDVMFEDTQFAKDFRSSYLVENFKGSNHDYFPTVLEADPKNQQLNLINKGSKYNTHISFGGNYSNKFYIGATFGFVSYEYESNNQLTEIGWTKTAAEIKPDNNESDFLTPGSKANGYTDINYELNDYIEKKIKGTGINLGVGMIYKPSWDWNIGLNISTPTWTTVQEESWLETTADYYKDEQSTTKLHPSYNSQIGGGTYDYAIISPWKTAVGLTKFFNRGLLTADLEYINYASIKYKETSSNPDLNFESMMQNQIADTYKGAVNLRIGTEILVTERLTARAGFNYLGSAYKNDDSYDHITSLGLGYVISRAIYIDLAAMQYKKLNYEFNTYPINQNRWDSPAPYADVKNSRTNIVLTVGTKF